MKKIISIILAMAMVLSLSLALFACNNDNVPSEDNTSKPGYVPDPNESPMLQNIHRIYYNADIGPQTITSVQTLATLTSISYTIDEAGPISVTPAKLNGELVTLVTLGGTEFVEGQATSIKESQLAAFGMDNDYLKAVVKLFDNGIVPANRPVIVTGISLGGMIAQQLISKVTDTHDIAAIITFGSPLTKPLDRQGIKVVRFVDSNDSVPVMGESMLFGKDITALDNAEKILRTSKYTEMVEVHALSYIEDECWDEFDFLGDTAHTNTLELLEKMTFYPAPKL